MESSLVSWQYENFSSAELVSPPVSPAPPSPSLYNNDGSLSPSSKHCKNDHQQSRAQMASSILNDLELFNPEMNDFGWDEESVNLGLFEELAEIEYTPPASPKKSSVIPKADQHQLTEHSISLTNLTAESPNSDTAAVDLCALSAEFQAILESLPKENCIDLSQVLQGVGIPTTIIDDGEEAMLPIELNLRDISDLELQNSEIDEVNNMHLIYEDDDDDMGIIEESEIYGLQSPAASIHSIDDGYMLISYENEVEDHHSKAAENILDALLKGDVTTAESFLPSIMHDDDESSMSSMDSQESEEAFIEDVTSPQPSTSRVEEVKKPERRGRKPGKRLAKGSLEYIKDKSLRKKEQNKTAATRYRQKKKVEVTIILDTESQLQKEHDDLQKNKDDLHRQILMVKQLLREVIKARKPAVASSSSSQGKLVVPGGRVTVSSVLARNRRK